METDRIRAKAFTLVPTTTRLRSGCQVKARVSCEQRGWRVYEWSGSMTFPDKPWPRDDGIEIPRGAPRRRARFRRSFNRLAILRFFVSLSLLRLCLSCNVLFERSLFILTIIVYFPSSLSYFLVDLFGKFAELLTINMFSDRIC